MPDQPFDLLNRHVPVSYETFQIFSQYHDLLLKWQEKINLVGPDTIGDAWARHFLDSLQLVNHIPNFSRSIVDLGSGAGFPGMVLAIYGITQIHLIESDGRKSIFLKEIARITKTPVWIHHCRIEDAPMTAADIITSRACSSLDQLLFFAERFFSHGTTCLFHKGKNYSKEVSDANERWLFQYEVLPSVTDRQGVILKVTDIKRRVV